MQQIARITVFWSLFCDAFLLKPTLNFCSAMLIISLTFLWKCMSAGRTLACV